MLKKPLQSSCVIAICMQRDARERVPDWEELAAVACAVQNMWLSCTAYNIGCYWSSPKAMIEGHEFLGLEPGQRCLGILYMGFYDLAKYQLAGSRSDLKTKVFWNTD